MGDLDEKLRQCRALEAAGTPDVLLTLADELLALAAHDPAGGRVVLDGLLLKARALVELDRRPEAMAVYDEFLGRAGHPHDVAVLLNVGHVLYYKACQLGRRPESSAHALAACSRLISLLEDEPGAPARDLVDRALCLQGQLYEWARDADRAISAWNTAINRSDDASDERDTRLLAELLSRRASVLRNTGRVADALSDYERVLLLADGMRRDPRVSDDLAGLDLDSLAIQALHSRAHILLHAGHVEEGSVLVAALIRRVSLAAHESVFDAAGAQALIGLGHSLIVLRDLPLAIEAYQCVIDLPARTDAEREARALGLMGLAGAQTMAGDEDAVASAHELMLDEYSDDALRALAKQGAPQRYDASAEEKFGQAVALFQRAALLRELDRHEDCEAQLAELRTRFANEELPQVQHVIAAADQI